MSKQSDAQSLFALESLNKELVAEAQSAAIAVVAKALAEGEIIQNNVARLQKTANSQIDA